MGGIHFIGGEKGGVGKSLTARLLAQYFVDRGMAFRGFDSDRSHSTFSRFYTDFSIPLDVKAFESMDAIIEMAEASPDINILVDLAAQSAQGLNKWIDDSDVFGILAELGQPAYLWHIMDDGADSAFLLERLLERHSGNAKLVVVLNMGRGENFSPFGQSDTYRKAQERGATFITLAKLQTGLMQKVDFSSLSFWAAANNRELMSIAERRRVAVWLENSYAQFDELLRQS